MATPAPTVFDSTSCSGFFDVVSPKSRLPVPSTTGKTIRCSSSTRSCSSNACASCALPCTYTSPLASSRTFAHLGDELAREHRRVVPFGVTKRRRHDVLRHVVELVGEVAGARGPGFGKALVCDAAEQQRLRLVQLVDLELVALVAAVDLEGPAAVLVVLGAARILHHAVERHELRHHDPAHLDHSFPSFRVCVHKTSASNENHLTLTTFVVETPQGP